MSTEVQALLTRLVGQFAEPYDFLRELVQNALDAGSDRAEVVLETHEEGGDEAVFELRVSDAGCGMDEAVIDNGLTRLFASTKSDDRTMAGGYGIGFVSVFAWEPEAVVVHTGKGGEAWELVFYPDRRFEKVALPEPVEGTTVTLLRRGQAHERAAIAEAVRDSLWRWCRFCKLEVSFEDVVGGAGPELIEDSPAEVESRLAVVEEQGDTHVRVAFAVPASAVLLRRGLILAEGAPGDLLGAALPELRADAGRTGEHVQVWVDSPLLRTTMARDKVLVDAGQREVLARVAAAVRGLRERLVSAIEQAVGEAGSWTRERHEWYGYLHAHLSRERKALGDAVRGRMLLRDVAGERALAPAGLGGLLRGRPVVTMGVEEGEASAERAAVLAAARAAGFPVVAAEAEDRRWLMELLEGTGPVVAWEQALVRERANGEAEGLRAAVERGLISAGVVVNVRLASGGEGRAGLVGVELRGPVVQVVKEEGTDDVKEVRPVEDALVLYAAGPWPESAWKGKVVWIAEDMLLRAALKAFAATPWTTATALTAAVLAALGQPPDAAAAASETLKDLAGKSEAGGG